MTDAAGIDGPLKEKRDGAKEATGARVCSNGVRETWTDAEPTMISGWGSGIAASGSWIEEEEIVPST